MNRSTGVVTVNFNGGSLAKTLSADTERVFLLISNGTSVGTWDISTGTGSGSGSGTGQINYIANPGAETDTSGWVTYADAAGAQPVDGTGGSPTVTWTRTTSSPLRSTGSFLFTKDAANRQGEGVAYAFSIDSADKAKILSVSFDYEITSGTFSTGDLTVYAYDVTNALVIQPAGYLIQSLSGTSFKHIATFQTSSNSSSYRFIIHTATTSASAYTLKFDNFIVGPQIIEYGAPVTNWSSYTPTFNGVGTPTSVDVWYRRVGDQIEVMGKFTTGTVTAAEARVSLPSGLTSDTTKIASIRLVGDWALGTTFGGNIKPTVLIESGVSYFTFGFDTATQAGLTKQNGNALFATGQTVAFHAKAPVSGWSSSVQMSNDTDTRVIALEYTGNGGTSLTANVTDIDFTTKVQDTHSAWSGTIFTAPVPGFYQFRGSVRTSASVTILLHLYVNGSQKITVSENPAATNIFQFSGAYFLNAGDTASIRSDTAATLTNNAVQHWIFIDRLSGPSAIAASETVAMRYYSSTTSVSGTDATIVYATKDFDTHGSYSSGVYTVPVSGKYSVNGGIRIEGTYALNSAAVLSIYKNSSAVSTTNSKAGGAVSHLSVTISDIISCVAGETIAIKANTDATSPTIHSSNVYNFISIVRAGN
jgi:hypothetical protein